MAIRRIVSSSSRDDSTSNRDAAFPTKREREISTSRLRDSFDQLHRRSTSLGMIQLSYHTELLSARDEDLRRRRLTLHALDVGMLSLSKLTEDQDDDNLVGLQFVSTRNGDWDQLSVDDDDMLNLDRDDDDDEPSKDPTKSSSKWHSPSSIIQTNEASRALARFLDAPISDDLVISSI
jgi:hypothetical protein